MADPTLHPDEEIIEGGPFIEDNPTGAARALFLGILLLMAGNGLQGSLIGVRSEAEGFSVTVAGFVMAAYFAGLLAGGIYGRTVIFRVGHIRAFAGLSALNVGAILCHAMVFDPLAWAVLRFVTGLCLAVLFSALESWARRSSSSCSASASR